MLSKVEGGEKREKLRGDVVYKSSVVAEKGDRLATPQ